MVGELLGRANPAAGLGHLQLGQRWQIFRDGIAQSTRPSSTSSMMAVEVMALVMEAIEKTASVFERLPWWQHRDSRPPRDGRACRRA